MDLVCLILNADNAMSKPSDLLYWNNPKSAEKHEGRRVISIAAKEAPSKHTDRHRQRIEFYPDGLPADCRVVIAFALDKSCSASLSLSDLKEVSISLYANRRDEDDLNANFYNFKLADKQAELNIDTEVCSFGSALRSPTCSRILQQRSFMPWR